MVLTNVNAKQIFAWDIKAGIVDDSGSVVPGQLDDSELYHRVISDDPDTLMPPTDSGRVLSLKQKDLLKRWIEQGAKWQNHWSLEKPVKHRLPVNVDKSWPLNPIDNFILDRLERENLSPSQTANRATLDLYGPDVHQPGTFAYNCLLARRMAERGVRFTQIFHRGWDQHGNLPNDLRNQFQDIDRATYGLITDMKQRGLLDDTLVVWGGEFGRTIYCQGGLTKTNYGRDHHPRCYTMWMAGAGIKGGVVHGETDDFSYNVVQDPVHIRDINATILTTLGIDHERFIVKHQGLDQRLTGGRKSQPDSINYDLGTDVPIRIFNLSLNAICDDATKLR